MQVIKSIRQNLSPLNNLFINLSYDNKFWNNRDEQRQKPSVSNCTFLDFFDFVELSSFPFKDATKTNAREDVLQNISTFKTQQRKRKEP